MQANALQVHRLTTIHTSVEDVDLARYILADRRPVWRAAIRCLACSGDTVLHVLVQ